jgi:uncharacterized protein HemY
LTLWDIARPNRYRHFSQKLQQVKTQKNTPTYWATLAEWYAFQGMWHWAIELFGRAQEQGYKQLPSLVLAHCYLKTGMLDLASKEYQKALSKKEAPHEYLQVCINSLEK